MAASFIIFFLAPTSASPTATAKSKILTPRRWSGPSGRFLYHFPAVTEGDRKMMQLGKMKISFFRRVLTLSTPRAAQSAAFEIRRAGFAGPRSGPSGRFLYHFLAAAEGSK